MDGSVMRAPMTQARAFQTLKLQAAQMRKPGNHLRTLWEQAPSIRKGMAVSTKYAFFDYGFQRVTPSMMLSAHALANEMGLPEHIAARFGGEIVNRTEKRAVGHHALRAEANEPFIVSGEDQMPYVQNELGRLEEFSERLISGYWKGVTGKPIKTIVSIGIGGSKYGPEVTYLALRDQSKTGITARFVSNVDPANLSQVMREIDPETTLIVVESKTFTTAETVEANAESAKAIMIEMLRKHASPEEIVRKHFVAVSTATELVQKFGIAPENMFPFKDWVGGRFSVWSAIGGAVLGPTLGFNNFKQFLAGARWADHQYLTAPFDQNISVLMAEISIINRVLMGWQSLVMGPYSHPLRDSIYYLTQGIMESLGKGVDIYGRELDFVACSVIMGDAGSDAQHSFFQYLHQIMQNGIVPVEFVAFMNALPEDDLPIINRNLSQQDRLFANLLGQRSGLAFGEENIKEPHRNFPGNRPSSLLVFNERSPFTVGAFFAFMENRIDAEGAIQLVAPYDQWGVEKGKKAATEIEAAMEAANIRGISAADLSRFDESTRRLIEARLGRRIP